MSRFAASLGLLALLLVAIVLPAPTLALSPTGTPHVASTPKQIGAVPLAQNNSTIHHEDPDDIQSEKDLSGLERWLAGRLSSRLGGSSVQIEQGEYEKARSVLGDDYNDLLSKYVDVSGKTEGTSDDKTAKTLQSTQQSQKRYVSRVQRYRTLYKRYQEAKRNGNDEKARQLARQLERLQADISQSSGNLTTNYDHLSNHTNVNTTNETHRIQNITQNISTQQASIRESEFVQTNLTMTVEEHRVSFLEPLRISGQLTDENGTGIGNQSIRLRLGGNRSKHVRTDDDGSFSLIGRPAITTLGRQSFRVNYQPANDAVYLGSNGTVRANVSPVSSTISIASHTRQARYNDTVSVSGHVRSEGIVATDVPVAISVDGTRLGTTRTATNGSYSFASSLPAGVSRGKHDVRVSFPFQNRALTATNATAPLSVRSTGTTLSLSGTVGKDRSVDLSGTLHTMSGTAIPGQRVAIFTNGTKVASTRTNENGTYRISLVLPATLVSENGNTTFVARFDGHGKNVKSARASTSLAISSGASGPLDENTRGWLVSFGVASLITLGGFFLWRSDFGGGRTSDAGDEMSTDVDVVTTSDDTDDQSSSPSAMAFLDRARSAREAGEFETAVEMGYAATRDQFTTVVPTAASTHWEFYNACREADLANETISAIGDVTERYERAAFAANHVRRETATSVIDAVSSLVEDE